MIKTSSISKHLLHVSARWRSPIVDSGRAAVIENRITIEKITQIRNTSHVPAAKILIEGVCPIEHILHVRHLTRIPVANRLIKMTTISKHLEHIRAGTRIPAADTWRATVIERIIIVPMTLKHLPHRIDIWHIPVPDILIKSHSSIIPLKHITHIRHRTSIPITNWLIKTSSINKHLMHVSDITYIPISNRLIKWSTVIKSMLHICYATGIPEIHITLITKFRTTSEYLIKRICS